MLRGECFHVVRPKFITVLRPRATKLPNLNFGSHNMKFDNTKQTLLLESLVYPVLVSLMLIQQQEPDMEWCFRTFTETVNFTNISVYTLRSITILSTQHIICESPRLEWYTQILTFHSKLLKYCYVQGGIRDDNDGFQFAKYLLNRKLFGTNFIE